MPPQAMRSGGYAVFAIPCQRGLVDPQGGRVDYTYAATEASYDHASSYAV